jgi:putative spermidine/putrescine transport system permease protein
MHVSGWAILRRVMCGLVLVYLLAPLIIIAILSFSSAQFLTFPPPGFSLQWYERFLSSPAWMQSFWTTVGITVPATLLATIFGTGAAIGVARSNIPFPNVLSGFIMTPLVVPTIITAAAVYGAFRRWGLSGTYAGLILAHVLLTIPFVFSITLAALRTVGPELERAALTLGASPLRVLFRVTVPMISPAITSGLLFAAVISFDELVVSMFLSTPSVRPITVRIWSDILGSVDPTISAISTAIFAVTLVLLLVDFLVTQRSKGTGRAQV